MIANKLKHLDEIAADRKVDVRGNTVSERGARRPEPDGAGQLIKMCMDGMDQAKFRCPRNLRNSAELSGLWRPQLHVVGAISWGHIEAYFIMSPDTKKDANMECTVLHRMLDLTAKKIDKENPG